MDTRKITMQQKVMKCIEDNLEVWSHVVKFQKDYDLFVKNLKQIEKQMNVATNDPEPIEQNIQKSREKLIAELLPVIKVISVFAYDKGMKKLEKKSLIDRENLEKMKPAELERQAFAIWRTIDKTMSDSKNKSKDVVNYGLSEKMISSLHDSVIMFSNLRANLKEEKKARKNAIEEINKLTKENNKILKFRIDKYIYLFEQSTPEFFKCYFASRKNKEVPEKVIVDKTQTVPKPVSTRSTAAKTSTTASRTRKTTTQTKKTTGSKSTTKGSNSDAEK